MLVILAQRVLERFQVSFKNTKNIGTMRLKLNSQVNVPQT